MSDASGLTTYGYDNRDRLTSKATPQGTLSYSYDVAGNLLSTRSSNTNGVSVSYSYDALNRLSTAADGGKDTRPATGSTSYSYDEVGNLSGYLYPNGVQSSYVYNTLNRLTSMSVNKGASVLASYGYTLGAAGNRLSVTEQSGRRVNYSYDDLYRLTNETITADAVTTNNGSIGYSYDAVGNRLSRSSSIAAVPSTTHAFDANDRLTTDSYDSNGNTISSAGNSYSFDFENRLTSLNNGQVSIVYDGDGNRVSKSVGGVTTRYLVDNLNHTGYAQVVEEQAVVGGQSSVVRAYTYGNDLISQQQLISGGWTASFFGYDGHGSVRMLTDASGAVTDTYIYDAFGILIHQTGTTANDYLYAGEQRDAHLGLDYLRARYMNPATGRFWSMDGFEGFDFDPLSLHKYTYAAADPVNKLDPTGQATVAEQIKTTEVNAVLNGIIVATRAADQARRLALAIRVVVALLVGTATLALRASRVKPTPRTRTDDKKDERHSGVLQVQGDDLQKVPLRLAEYPDLKYDYRNGEGTISWSWNESAPLPAIEASRHLQQLAEVLTPKQLVRREQAFKEASRFIINAANAGGVPGFFSDSFPKNKRKYGVDYLGGPRVDIVVYSGLAFVP